MIRIPEHIRAELRELIAEGLPVEQIAFMMRLHESVVREEMARIDTTRDKDQSVRH
jgi:hypothetical protein